MSSEPAAPATSLSMGLLMERKRLLDDVWLMALFALFVCVGAPWYLRALEINFTPVAWSLFGYGAFYLFASFGIEALPSRRLILLGIAAAQVTGVLFLGWIWHLTGSMQNPMFLLAFVLPVVAASLVPVNWQAYGTAVLAFLTVMVVALVDTPELRWLVAQFGSAVRRFAAALPQSPAPVSPFPTLNSPPAYYFVLLAMFAALLSTVALMTESLTSFLGHVSHRLESATRDRGVAEDLSSGVLRSSPMPAALVYADSFRVAQASGAFLRHFLLSSDALLDQDLFSLVEFAHPEVVQALITGSGGEVPIAAYRIDGEERAAKVWVSPVSYGGRRYAYVHIQDSTEFETLAASFNAVDEALLVLNARQRVLYCNRAAEQIWGPLPAGADASAALRQANLPEGWWELGIRSRQERRLELNRKPFVAVCVAARILGERETLNVMRVRPVEAGS